MVFISVSWTDCSITTLKLLLSWLAKPAPALELLWWKMTKEPEDFKDFKDLLNDPGFYSRASQSLSTSAFTVLNLPFLISDISRSARRTAANFISSSDFIMRPLFPIVIVTRHTLTAELLAKLIFPHLKGRFFQS